MRVRRPARAALAILVLVAALLAGSTAAAAVPLRDAQTVSVKVWSASVCKGFAIWEHKLTKLNSTGAADATAAKAAIIRFLAGAAKATGRLARTLKRAGVPSVKHGKEIAATFVRSVKGLRVSYVEAKTAAAALPTGDPVAAQALTTQLQTAETTLHTAVSEAAKKYPAKKLDTAFATTKACNDLS